MFVQYRLIAASRYGELPIGSFQDPRCYKAYDSEFVAVFYVVINSFSRFFFK